MFVVVVEVHKMEYSSSSVKPIYHPNLVELVQDGVSNQDPELQHFPGRRLFVWTPQTYPNIFVTVSSQ